MDLFRFRCYLASLQGGELPNPKRLLAVASRPTKLAMGRLGIFSVSSFHALVNGHASLWYCFVALQPLLLDFKIAALQTHSCLSKLLQNVFSVVFKIYPNPFKSFKPITAAYEDEG